MGVSKDNFFKNFLLGVTAEAIPIDSRQLNHDAIVKLLASANDNIAIISRHLDPTVFNKEDFIQSATEFVRRSKNASLRILVHDTSSLIKNNHRALHLTQRVSSKIEIRTICDDFSQFNQAFLVADSKGYIHNLKADLYDAEVNFNDTEKSKELMEKFTSIWELCTQDTGIRRLCI
ncbi:MAG: hypothetical protein AAF304_02920 [Pseudomonadota bacterium]